MGYYDTFGQWRDDRRLGFPGGPYLGGPTDPNMGGPLSGPSDPNMGAMPRQGGPPDSFVPPVPMDGDLRVRDRPYTYDWGLPDRGLHVQTEHPIFPTPYNPDAGLHVFPGDPRYDGPTDPVMRGPYLDGPTDPNMGGPKLGGPTDPNMLGGPYLDGPTDPNMGGPPPDPNVLRGPYLGGPTDPNMGMPSIGEALYPGTTFQRRSPYQFGSIGSYL